MAVLEDRDMLNWINTSFWDLQFTTCSKSAEPNSNPSADDAGEADIVFEDLDRNTMAVVIPGELELGQVEFMSDSTKEINEFYGLCDELDVEALEENWIMGGSFELIVLCGLEEIMGLGRSVAAPVDGESQKLLKKALASGAWANNGGDDTARAQESINTKNHVISERRRREKLNEMFLILKSLVPSIHKGLEHKVEELESNRAAGIAVRKCHEVPGKKVLAGSKRKAPEVGGDDAERVLTKDDGLSSVVNVTVTDKEVLLEVQCQWKELLMTQVFDAIKSLCLDVLSVRAVRVVIMVYDF
uniref:Anthocyanin regulatory R-S protein n=1 Tax=Aegilops tauschii TaxID=37682 RepID=M8BYJ6_AEGTA